MADACSSIAPLYWNIRINVVIIIMIFYIRVCKITGLELKILFIEQNPI